MSVSERKNPYKVEVFLPAPGSSWILVYANGKIVYAGGRFPTIAASAEEGT